MNKSPEFYTSDNLLKTIAYFKLFKGAVLVVTGLIIMSYLNGNVTIPEDYRNLANLGPAHHLLQKILLKVSLIDKTTFKHITIGTFIYAFLFFIEGIGLYLEKKWAEYFTIFMSSSLVPLELYELIIKASLIKFLIIALNIFIIYYLAKRLKKEKSIVQENKAKDNL